MAKSIFAGNKNSQYDPGQIQKEVHDFHGQAIRTLDTRSLVDQYYTHFNVDYDVNDNPIEVSYYRGTKAYKTTFNAISAATLGGKYLTVNSAPDNQKYAIWFNVDNLSSQPFVANAEFIEISISSSDPAEIVGLAIAITINNLYSDKFKVTRNGTQVEILTAGLGLVDSSTAGTSGLTLTLSSGEQELVKKVVIEYDGADPVFEGQTLKDYYYDIYSGKFVKNASTVISGTVDTVTKNKLFSKPYNKIEVLSKDTDGNPLEVESSLNGVPVQLVTIVYDVDGDFLSAEVTDL